MEYTAESSFIGFNESKGNVYKVKYNASVRILTVTPLDIQTCRQI